MKTNLRAFQRGFSRMRRLAAGAVIVVESGG
jgi:hypothetical protein